MKEKIEMLSLDEIDWRKLYSSCVKGIRVYEILTNLQTADYERVFITGGQRMEEDTVFWLL